MSYLLDPERDHLRQICTPIVERVAREMHSKFRTVITAAPEWELASESLRAHWERCAWRAVTGSIANADWPSLQASAAPPAGAASAAG